MEKQDWLGDYNWEERLKNGRVSSIFLMRLQMHPGLREITTKKSAGHKSNLTFLPIVCLSIYFAHLPFCKSLQTFLNL